MKLKYTELIIYTYVINGNLLREIKISRQRRLDIKTVKDINFSLKNKVYTTTLTILSD